MRHRKRTNKRKESASSGGHGWAWLLFGVILGSILGSIGYIKWYESRPRTLPAVATTIKSTKLPKPTFDFYTLLPEAKVDATRKPDAMPQKAPAVATTSTQPPKKSPYRLQLASFKSYQDADALKAKLALSGFTVEIQSVKLDGGALWYRVQTPPLASEKEALRMQSALKTQAINSVVMQPKG